MSTAQALTFHRIADDECTIRENGDTVGSIWRHAGDNTRNGFVYTIHLDEDPRGWHHVHDRRKLLRAVIRRIASHPLWRC